METFIKDFNKENFRRERALLMLDIPHGMGVTEPHGTSVINSANVQAIGSLVSRLLIAILASIQYATHEAYFYTIGRSSLRSSSLYISSWYWSG